MSKLDHLQSWHSDWSELKAVVFGLGVSGFSVADTLNELGATVLVIADKADDKSLDILDALGIDSLIGKDSETVAKRFSEFGAQLVVTSPGIKPDNALLVQAGEADIEIWTDIGIKRGKRGISSNVSSIFLKSKIDLP